jgi:hypothetical protein
MLDSMIAHKEEGTTFHDETWVVPPHTHEEAIAVAEPAEYERSLASLTVIGLPVHEMSSPVYTRNVASKVDRLTQLLGKTIL